MDYVGIDVHKKQSQICIVAEGGELIECRVRNDPGRFAEVLERRPRARILIEASTDSEWMARGLEGLGNEVVVANPNFAPMYAARRRAIKTDRRDARALADACVLGAYRPAHRLSDAAHPRGRPRQRTLLVPSRGPRLSGTRRGLSAGPVARDSHSAFAPGLRATWPRRRAIGAGSPSITPSLPLRPGARRASRGPGRRVRSAGCLSSDTALCVGQAPPRSWRSPIPRVFVGVIAALALGLAAIPAHGWDERVRELWVYKGEVRFYLENCGVWFKITASDPDRTYSFDILLGALAGGKEVAVYGLDGALYPACPSGISAIATTVRVQSCSQCPPS